MAGWLAALSLSLAGCDVEWGGAELALVDPGPETNDSASSLSLPSEVALPHGPLLFAVAASGVGGAARSLPVAVLGVDGLQNLGAEAGDDETFWKRFAAEFEAPGTELGLYAGDARIGSIVLDTLVGNGKGSCPAPVTGHVLLLPGASSPRVGFAYSATTPPRPSVQRVADVDDRMRTFGPILAERLLAEGGEPRPYLARRVDMQAVPYANDSRPALAATYIVADDLAGAAPEGRASSLFFLARFQPDLGYSPVWSEMRRYGGGSGKQVLTFLAAFAAPFGRVETLIQHDGLTQRLVARTAGEGQRGIDWRDAEGCGILGALGITRLPQ